MGHAHDWESTHQNISNLIADHRHCPSIITREQVGITLFMPYTARFYRNRKVEVETYWEESGPRVVTIEPRQESVKINPRSKEAFPGFHATLPSSSEMLFPLHIFILGDIRVNAWIIQSGVQMMGLPDNYSLAILPINYEIYPSGLQVCQSLVYSLDNINGLLKIPLDLDFSRLPPGQNCIEIPKGVPMVQYLPMILPEISLEERYAREK
ncbi:MAG: hypothetical protein R3257_03750 [bacterium]|nr:hypothetical protein [bacterium]